MISVCGSAWSIWSPWSIISPPTASLVAAANADGLRDARAARARPLVTACKPVSQR